MSSYKSYAERGMEISSLEEEVERLTKQRDELVEILDAILTSVPFSQSHMKTFREARAALAAVKEKP
jgi:hypothetical protein